MSAFLRKYAVATHVYIPIVKRGVVDFAVGADWSPAAGDVKVSIDGGAVANIGTLPTAIASGNGAFWDFTLASGETTGKKITVVVADAATKAVEDQAFVVETYGNASAEHPFDLGTATQAVNVTQFGGNNATTSGGRPEVNLSHIAGAAVSTSTAQLGVNVVNQGGSAGTFASGRAEVNVTHAAGAAITAAAGRMEVNVSHFGGSAGTFASGRPEVNSTHFAGTAFASAVFTADVTKFNGVAVTSSGGRPEVNTTHWAGTAVGSVTFSVNVASFGGVAGTFSGGRPEVNTVRIANTVQTAVDVGAQLDAAVSTRATPAQVNTEVVDVLVTDTHGELSGVPGITCSVRDMVRWMFTLSRNKVMQTDTQTTLRNDADSADLAQAPVSDDGTTAVRGEFV